MLCNKPRTIETMKKCGIDVLIATSPLSVTYFSDYYSWLGPLFREYMATPGASSDLGQYYVVLPAEGEPALVLSPHLLVNALDSWVTDLRTYGRFGFDGSFPPGELSEDIKRIYELTHADHAATTPTAALIGLLKERGWDRARIGIEKEGLVESSKRELDQKLTGADLRDCSNLIRLIRMVKTPEELARMTRAMEISEIAAMESFAMARPGARMLELAQHYRRRIAEEGANLDHYSWGINGLGFATQTDHRLTDGEVFYADWGCRYRQYLADTGTTVALGEPGPEIMKRHEVLRECVRAARGVIRPGARATAVHATMCAVVQESGLTGTGPQGHGLGLEIREYPVSAEPNDLRIKDDCIDIGSDLPLERDMVFNLESAYFMPGVASVHIETSLVVTEDGCRPLAPHDRTGPVIVEA